MMPRKKNEEGKPMDATGQVLKTVRLELPADLHKKLASKRHNTRCQWRRWLGFSSGRAYET